MTVTATGQITANRWCENGDHPQDACHLISPDPESPDQFAPFLSEGKVVRYYRHPLDNQYRKCGDCGREMRDHGWIDQGPRGRAVCPGDWIIGWPQPDGSAVWFPAAPDLLAAVRAPVSTEAILAVLEASVTILRPGDTLAVRLPADTDLQELADLSEKAQRIRETNPEMRLLFVQGEQFAVLKAGEAGG